MNAELLERLALTQTETVNLFRSIPETDYRQQFHPDLSPLGWHLGHCIYTETYWIREQLLQKEILAETLKALYVPELCIKVDRGEALPEHAHLIEWALQTQADNQRLLTAINGQAQDHALLKKDYLLHFLIQHYAQHCETMQMVLTERQLSNKTLAFVPEEALTKTSLQHDIITLAAGSYTIGATPECFHYDNEYQQHTVELTEFNIAATPVSNAEYLGFMEAGAYRNPEYWTAEGWDWCSNHTSQAPQHWRQNDQGDWFGINHHGAFALETNAPVYGVCYHEAMAFATWAQARLPHEYEWETAAKNGVLKETGTAWEWCENSFHPYPGFVAYPYPGYSKTYFDDRHFALRGGSQYTDPLIKRPTFRNYYTADKRHIFAGLRLAYD